MLIVTGSDDNYVPGVLVLIASAAWHNPGVRFAVLGMGISQENCQRIEALGKRLNVPVQMIEISEKHFGSIPVRRSHLTRSTYLRLLIPQLMPDETRVIYMDCDMAVVGDLSLLDQIDLGDHPIAAVACPTPDHREVAATGVPDGKYVNAGLLVMNLPVWRRENLAQLCLDLLTDPERPLLSEDQSAINIACRGRILYLPYRYNVYAAEATYREVGKLPTDVAVLHYVVNVKPWLWNVSYGEIWQFHADRIRDLMPPPRPRKLSQRLTRLEMHRRMAFGLAMGRKKHWQRLKVRAAIRDGLVASYLVAQRERLRKTGAHS